MGVLNLRKIEEERDYHIIKRIFLKIDDKSKKFKITKIHKYKVHCNEGDEGDFSIEAMKYVAEEITKEEGKEGILEKAQMSVSYAGIDCEKPSARMHYNSQNNELDYVTIEGGELVINCAIIDENTRYYEECSQNDYEVTWKKEYNVDFNK